MVTVLHHHLASHYVCPSSPHVILEIYHINPPQDSAGMETALRNRLPPLNSMGVKKSSRKPLQERQWNVPISKSVQAATAGRYPCGL